MYISSDGTKKSTSEMNYEYLVNALAKNLREIFESKNIVEYNKFASNIQVLERECDNRLDKFLTSKMDDEEWI